MTSNSENALRSILRKLFPEMARYIEAVGNDIGECNYIRILEFLIDKSVDDDIKRIVEKDFEALKQETKYGRVPVRAKRETINKYE